LQASSKWETSSMTCLFPSLRSPLMATVSSRNNPIRMGCKCASRTRPTHRSITKEVSRLTVDTVRTQFVYELQGIKRHLFNCLGRLTSQCSGVYYYNPDVIADLTNVSTEQVGPGRVRVWGARGAMPLTTLKVPRTSSLIILRRRNSCTGNNENCHHGASWISSRGFSLYHRT
jgi:hypothetical protein